MQAGKLNVIIDGQWGSTGKGALAGALTPGCSVTVCDFMPQAGHTVFWGGKKYVFRQLPVGVLQPGHVVYIGPGAVIDESRFLVELEWVAPGVEVVIDWRVPLLEGIDHANERATNAWMGSTCEGCGSCLSRKVRRLKDVKFITDSVRILSHKAVTTGDVHQQLSESLGDGHTVMVESAQGFGLSLNHGFYPHVTSRDVTLTSILDRIGGFHPEQVGDVWASLRSFPIRVGGPSGPCFSDQKELDWSELPCPPAKPERTTVTDRVRRIFTWSNMQYRDFIDRTRPTHIRVSFLDYVMPVSDIHVSHVPNSRVLEWLDVNVRKPYIDVVGRSPKLMQASFGPGPEDYVSWS